tara:strand:+ start:4709 stop:5293 length:585 start_codon:yes stop_codon:yes gene_type:complete
MPNTKSTKRSQGTTVVSVSKHIAANTLYFACALCSFTKKTRLPSNQVKYRNQQKKRHADAVAEHEKSTHSGKHCVPNSLGSVWPVSADGSIRSRCHRCDAVTKTPGGGRNQARRNEQQLRHRHKLSSHTCSSSATRSDTPGRVKPGLEVLDKLTEAELSSFSADATSRCTALSAEARTAAPAGRKPDEAKVCSP